MYFAKQITQEELRRLLSYDPETGEFTWIGMLRKKGRAGTPQRDYWVVTIHGRHQYAHRLAWIYVNGAIPDGMVIDHINGIGTDNRIANLRLATHRENSRNNKFVRGKKNIFQHHQTRYWTGQIRTIKDVRLTIGSYETKEDAEYVYNKIAPLFLDGV